MSKLKIALYTTTFPPKLGGIATSNYNLYNLLKESYDIKLFVYNESNFLNDKNIVYDKVPKWIANFVAWSSIIYLKKFDKNDEFKSCKAIINFGVKIFSLNRSLKKFNPDIILVADNGIPAYALKKPYKAKLIWFARNNYQRFQNQILCPTISSTDNQVACSMERNAVKKADAIISPSNYMVNVCKESFKLDIPIYVNRNIILKDLVKSIKTLNIKELLKIPDNYPLVYIPSAGSSIKGKRYVYEIIRQLRKHTDNKIGFYLSGPLPQDLQFELSLLKDTQIYKPGHVSWEKNIALMSSCSLCITPNIIENYSNAILEAQTLQIPVVAFDTGGNKEIVKNNHTGFIVPYLDTDELIEKSKFLLSNSKIYNLFKHNCKERIDEIANESVILENYHKIFKELMAISN